MKYCPYCGTELIDSTVSFCPECGKVLEKQSGSTKKKKREKRLFSIKLKKFKNKTKSAENKPDEEKVIEQMDECYDGYYDDVLPQDNTLIQQSLDKDLIKRLVLLGIGFIVVIGICITVICLS